MGVNVDQTQKSVTGVSDRWWAPALLGVAALGWWWSIRSAQTMTATMSDDMRMGAATMTFATFLVAWVAMMAAMMLPAILPVVRLYARAAARGTVAPVGIFLVGYAAVWSAIGVPAYVAWRTVDGQLADATPLAGRVAGVVLVAAAIYQLSPLKSVCLRHCRSPLSFFMRHSNHLDRPSGAIVAGARHGLFCVGCCWMLMAVLVAFGTMELWWMAGLAALILLEKATHLGEQVAVAAGIGFAVLGVILLVHPATISRFI